jgi:hypothetical protein
MAEKTLQNVMQDAAELLDAANWKKPVSRNCSEEGADNQQSIHLRRWLAARHLECDAGLGQDVGVLA